MNSPNPAMDHAVNFHEQAPSSDSNRNLSGNKESLFKRLEGIMSISQLIRGLGACAILASMSIFMLQGWAEGNDITRYLKLLAQTGLLTGAGLALSFLIKEFKGARVFFALALVSVAANFTILGSLTYSLFPMDQQIVVYPESMLWEVTKTSIFLPVFLGAVSLLSAVAYFSFSIFSRQIAKPLSLGFLGLSALLLVPVRAPLIAVGLAAVALWGAWLLIQRLRKTKALIMTKETKTSLGILLLPGLIILSRALSFYSFDDLTLLALSGLVYIALKNIISLISIDGLIARVITIAQFLLGAFIALMATEVSPNAWNSVDILFGAAIFMAFAVEQLRSSATQQWKTLITSLTTCGIVPLAIINALINPEFSYSVQALLIVSLAFALTIYASRNGCNTRLSRIVSTTGLLIALLLVLFDVVQLAQLGNWIIIGLSGAILIIGASVYERFGLKLSAQ